VFLAAFLMFRVKLDRALAVVRILVTVDAPDTGFVSIPVVTLEVSSGFAISVTLSVVAVWWFLRHRCQVLRCLDSRFGLGSFQLLELLRVAVCVLSVPLFDLVFVETDSRPVAV